MPSRISPGRRGSGRAWFCACFLWLGGSLALPALTPDQFWPAKLEPVPAELIKEALKTFPAELRPAIDFQRVLGMIFAGGPESAWRPEMQRLAALQGEDPVSRSVRELAMPWLARSAMVRIDAALRAHYRLHVRFPDSLKQIELAPELQSDPWGGAWTYKIVQPGGFSRQKNQRYQIAPSKFPKLTSLEEVLRENAPRMHGWEIKTVAGAKALQFRPTDGSAAVALIQPGGVVGSSTLVYIGSGWALMAETDRYYIVNF